MPLPIGPLGGNFVFKIGQTVRVIDAAHQHYNETGIVVYITPGPIPHSGPPIPQGEIDYVDIAAGRYSFDPSQLELVSVS